MPIRRAAVAGSWYPGTAPALAAAIDRYLAAADALARGAGGDLGGAGADLGGAGADVGGAGADVGGAGADVGGAGLSGLRSDPIALVAPHAGLMYSGPVAAHAYRLIRDRPFDLIVLVGPSHFVAFEGVAAYPSGGFDTPFGVAAIDEESTDAICGASSVVRPLASPHEREHSLEMQLPFVQRLAPQARIVPLLIGRQTPATAAALADALVSAVANRRALLVASSDLSHYHDSATAARLDAVVLGCLERFDADGLQHVLAARPEHACGGGPIVAVMRAARLLGARDGAVLRYADSGDVSGDKSSVVGYAAARFSASREGVTSAPSPVEPL